MEEYNTKLNLFKQLNADKDSIYVTYSLKD